MELKDYNYHPDFLERNNKWYDDMCDEIRKNGITEAEIYKLLDELRIRNTILQSAQYYETLLAPLKPMIIECKHNKDKCMFKEVK